ncbi:MAG: HD domain-containing phosphohydrolase, partial [Actinomycetota bacterium]
MAVGLELGLAPAALRTVGLGALLHDIGKLEIDDAVLHKPGKLNAEEFEHIKTHTTEGERLVLGSPGLADLGPTVRHHHERIDGRGYPDGLAGDDIPLTARIVSVCDAYDAMVHTRQYRAGMGDERARAVLIEHRGAQWDPEIVDALLELSDRGAIASTPTVLADLAGQVGHSCTHELPEPATVT